MRDADFIIIGSGPAGVAAAWPLVSEGRRVLMLDAGTAVPMVPDKGRVSLATARRVGDARWLLGQDDRHLRFVGDSSPKMRTAAPAGFEDGHAELNKLDVRGFRNVGTLSLAGLSSVWGAVCCILPPQELSNWPQSVRESLPQGYSRVAARMGLSGCGQDADRLGIGGDVALMPALPLSAPAQKMLVNAISGPDFAMGRPISAVLTKSYGDRSACVECRGCMWGCHVGAVWSAANDLIALAGYPNFTLETGFSVIAVVPSNSGWSVIGTDGKVRKSRKVLSAAGTLASTRLVLAAAGMHDRSMAFQHAPAMGFALVLPEFLGRAQDESGYGNAQLAFRLKVSDSGDEAFGLLYDADVMAAADLIARMPLTRPGAVALTRTLASSMMLGLVYMPGRFSQDRLQLVGDRLLIQGGLSEDAGAAVTSLRRRLKRQLRQAGGWVLPGSLQMLQPGAEVHVGASLPMGSVTSELGELEELPGLHVVDGAVLPDVGARHHTFTVMVNADRIAAHLSATD